jgi:hypothetical protein
VKISDVDEAVVWPWDVGSRIDGRSECRTVLWGGYLYVKGLMFW